MSHEVEHGHAQAVAERPPQVSFAIHPGIKKMMTPSQMAAVAEAVGPNAEIEVTHLQHLIVTMDFDRVEEAKKKIWDAGLAIYPVGPVVKPLRTCNFCHGDEEEGLPTAVAIHERTVGKRVPFTLRTHYTGCPNACGEPLLGDVGVLKRKETYEVYVGGHGNGVNARTGKLLAAGLGADEVVEAVDRVIDVYARLGKKRERFWKFLDRLGVEQLRAEAGLPEPTPEQVALAKRGRDDGEEM